MSDVVPVDPVDDDASYGELVAKLNASFPPVDNPRGIDFSRIKGHRRVAKAIVLHLCTACGWPPEDIATSIGLRPDEVYNLLYDAIQDNIEINEVETLRKLEWMKLNQWEKKASDGYARSLEDAVTITEKETKDGTFTEKSSKGQSGNPAYQRILLEIQKRRAALTGMDMPTKVQVNKDIRQVRINIVEVKDREHLAATEPAGLIEKEEN